MHNGISGSWQRALTTACAIALPALLAIACGDGANAPAEATPTACTGTACPAPAGCTASGCGAGSCAGAESLGKPTVDQVPGDCQSNVCAANGAIETRADDSDVPPSLDCESRACANGKVVTTPLATGTKCENGACDGKGSCVTAKLGNGDACTTEAQCGSGFCVDGVCCGDACTGECKSCGLEGSKGTCSNIPRFGTDSSYFDPVFLVPDVKCEVVALCDGQGKCRQRIAKTCSADADCLSNKCFQAATRICLGGKGEACQNHAQCASGTCNGMGSCD